MYVTHVYMHDPAGRVFRVRGAVRVLRVRAAARDQGHHYQDADQPAGAGQRD